MADIDGVYCLVLNSKAVAVGREYITAEPQDSAVYMQILDRCPGPMGKPVLDECSYAVDVHVEMTSGYPFPKAISFKPMYE